MTPARIQFSTVRRLSSAASSTAGRGRWRLRPSRSRPGGRRRRCAGLAGDLDDVGQVQLALRVVRVELPERGAQELGVERVHAGVDLGDGRLLLGGVGLLHDLGDLTVVGQTDDPTVAPGLGGGERQHRDRRGGGFAAVLVDESVQGAAVEQGDVRGGDQHGPVEVGGQGGQAAFDGVPGAVLLLLYGDRDRAAQFRLERADGHSDAFLVMTDDGDEVRRIDLRGGVQGMRQHRASAQGVQHLGGLRPHPSSRAGGEDDHGGLHWHEAPSGSFHSCCSRQLHLQELSPQLLLRRQDSNLNYLNQNQRCCHYTTADCHTHGVSRPFARENPRMPTRRTSNRCRNLSRTPR